AAADIARYRALDRVERGVLLAVEERLERHDHARRAEPALERVALDELALERVRLVGRADPFDRLDALSRAVVREEHARDDGLGVDDHGARAARAAVADVLRSRDPETLAEEVEERRPRLAGERDRLAVQDEVDFPAARRDPLDPARALL